MKYNKKCIINVRGNEHGNSDTNLLDFFNPHIIFKDLIRSLINKLFLIKLLKNLTGKNWKLDRINLYINISVINTRNYHIDTKYDYIKIFIPLTNIKDIDDGPFSYILNSHLNKSLTNNNYINFYPINIGDIVIAYQNGFHRGLPQKKDRIRIVLVYGFKLL